MTQDPSSPPGTELIRNALRILAFLIGLIFALIYYGWMLVGIAMALAEIGEKGSKLRNDCFTDSNHIDDNSSDSHRKANL